MTKLKLTLLCFFVFLGGFAFANTCGNENASSPTSNENFPNEIVLNYNNEFVDLKITGVATRKKYFISLYNVAHYIENGFVSTEANIFDSILDENAIKQLTINWLWSIDADKIKDAYNDSFKKILSFLEYEQLQNEISLFLNCFNEGVTKGEENILLWLPEGSIQIWINGNKTEEIVNSNFAKVLWSIWFGDNAVVSRDDLISLM